MRASCANARRFQDRDKVKRNTEAKKAGAMAALEAGSTLKDLARAKIVSNQVFHTYCESDPEWGKRAKLLVAANAVAKHRRTLEAQKAKHNAVTHCQRGHDLSLPGVRYTWISKGYSSWRCAICHLAGARAGNRPMSLDQARQLVEGAQSGLSLSQMTKGGSEHYVTGFWKTKAFLSANPAIHARLQALFNANSRANHLAAARGRRVSAHLSSRSSDQAERAMMAIQNAVPSGLPKHHRDEIVSRMLADFVEGKLKLKDIRTSVRAFISIEYKQFGQYIPVIGGVMGSLDQAAFDDGPTTVGDLVTRGLWD